ncbi:MAG TPA: CinA family nicotinamide mononucleotide deamidase-related protein [Gaiellaceae bacterium]|nr:CinA family nicotinamide mononucleotide deamidase-related protein [Gaiellaceae bacterium]
MDTRARALVVLTGSELVRGDRADANGAFLGRELTRLGLQPARLVIVGDDPAELEAAVREGLEGDVLVLSGGLGPTHDDRTIETLARATGRPLVLVEELRSEIEAVSRGIAARLGRPYGDFEAGVRKQASVPKGGFALGLAGTAPAVLLEHERGVAVALPGPPNELQRLWPRVLAHEAFARVLAHTRPPEHTVLRLFGPSESAVASALAEAGGETDGLEVTVCAHDLELRIDLFARTPAREHAPRVAAALRRRFRDELFAEDERPVAELVLDLCRNAGLTLATAESCTGGLVGARLTDVPGSSDVFLGGIVAYSDEAKRRQLGVAEELLREHGAVSGAVAAAMAKGAQTALGADVAVAVTGVAGPGGGTAEKPVGLVFIHAESPDGDSARKLQLPGDRGAIRARATAVALHALRQLLTRSTADRYA